MQRGRPRHDDILTPREWQVLDLIRQGLTNEQIADRLDISLATAKFHVSEIIGKLGVESRREAAAWQGRPKVATGLAPLGWLRSKLGGVSPLRTAGAIAIAGGVVAMAVLVAGVLLMSARSGTDEPEANVESRTGDEALDAVLESLLEDSATALATRFAGIAAREGSVVGGPVGIYEPRTVGTDEWTLRLGDSDRSLYAVVSDAREPYDWYQANPPPLPRAAVFDGERDYDILLVVDEGEGDLTPWRFSLASGRIVDVVIDQAQASPGQPASPVSLVVQLANLMPSPADEPHRFAILPPEDQWPPPVTRGATGQPRPAGVAEPSLAPDGRTGAAATDALIELLLTGDAAGITRAAGQVRGSEERCMAGTVTAGSCQMERISVPPGTWINQLAQAESSLYAVTTGDPSGMNLYLAVDTGEEMAEAWIFGVEGGRITQLAIHRRLAIHASRPADLPPPPFLQLLSGYTPSPAYQYERFYVLPPQEELPQPPAGHALSVRTGDAQVDGLLALIQSGDVAGFSAAVETDDGLLVRSCRSADQRWDDAAVLQWAAETLPRAYRLDSVVVLPRGYTPSAEHLIIALSQTAPFKWDTLGVLESEGRVRALLLGEEMCGPTWMYPPESYIVAPPARDLDGLDPARRSGIAIIDATLDAAYAGDAAALEDMVAYQPVPCAEYDYAVRCPDGAPVGTPVDAIPSTGCHGGYETRGSAGTRLVDPISAASLYAVTGAQAHPNQPLGPGQGAPPVYRVVMASGASQAFVLSFTDEGISAISRGCGFSHPNWFLTGAPAFLLPPP